VPKLLSLIRNSATPASTHQTGRAGGRGKQPHQHNPKQQQQQQQQQSKKHTHHDEHGHEPHPEHYANGPVEESMEKMSIGNKLYYAIAKLEGEENAGKLTGMFLDYGWTPQQLVNLAEDESRLREKIEEAKDVLSKASKEHTGQ